MILLAYLGIALLPFAELPKSVWIGLLGMPFGVRAASRALSTAQTAAIIPAQRWLLISFCLAALGSGFGMLL